LAYSVAIFLYLASASDMIGF